MASVSSTLQMNPPELEARKLKTRTHVFVATDKRSESPENPIVLNNLGAALLTLGRHEEGVAMLEMSMNAGAMANLGAHWQEEGDLDRARSLYTRQVYLTPACC